MLSFSVIVQHFPYFGLFCLFILGGIGLPFPEGATLILCGFLISTKVIKLFPAFLIAYSGILIGDFLFYNFGRKYGRMIVTHKRFRKIISPEKLSMFEEKFNKFGILFIIIGGRLLGEIFLMAGIMRMPPLKLLIVDSISLVFTIAFWAGIGYVGGHSLQIVQQDITRIEHIVILMLILLLIIWLIFRHIKSRRGVM